MATKTRTEMKATARRTGTFTHSISVRGHQLNADEPLDRGGDDNAPNPEELLAASLASCTAITMEMYAKRKGWDIGDVEVSVNFALAERGSPTHFDLDLKLPRHLTDEQVDRLKVIAAKCPIHRALESDVSFDEHVELVD